MRVTFLPPQAFKQEITYAAHLSLPAVLVPLKTRRFANLARTLNEHIMGSLVHQVRYGGILCGKGIIKSWFQRPCVDKR